MSRPRTDEELITAVDPTSLTEVELRRLAVLSAAAQHRLEEQLLALRAPPSRNFSLLLDASRWKEVLLDAPDVYKGEQFLRSYFKDALKTTHWAEGTLMAVVHLMDLHVALGREEAHLLSAARRLLAEMVVANSAATGMKTTALKTIRSVLVQEELPANVTRAQARIIDRLTQPDRPQPGPEKGS